jgi:uncharacterized protein YidB (DUF937 family)
MALMALLAAKMAPGASAQQNPASGLGGLLDQFKQNGLEQVINSWIGTGENKAISPAQLRQALGQDSIDELAEQTGLPHDDLLSQLSRILPGVIDKLTPNGQLPPASELLAGPR